VSYIIGMVVIHPMILKGEDMFDDYGNGSFQNNRLVVAALEKKVNSLEESNAEKDEAIRDLSDKVDYYKERYELMKEYKELYKELKEKQ
jgi:cell division protein FtsB